jgi:hypothetical protein
MIWRVFTRGFHNPPEREKLKLESQVKIQLFIIRDKAISKNFGGYSTARLIGFPLPRRRD